jgi:hypothetical protein
VTLCGLCQAAPAPPAELKVEDVPDDAGTALKVKWRLSPDDDPKSDSPKVIGYRLVRESESDPQAGAYVAWLRAWHTWQGTVPPDHESVMLSAIAPGTKEFVDQNCQPGRSYVYRLHAVGPDETVSEPVISATIAPVVSWFITKWKTLLLFFTTILICGGLLISTELARRGKPIYIRPIAGLQAIEEAVGRATEMGRPMLYVPGIQDMNEIQTVAGVTVLSHVAQTAAQYDMQLDVPTSRSLVMTAARDAAQAGCLKADRPDVYDESKIYYVTDDQFSFVAHVGGRMIREKPAACFYIGQFFAESLLLAETGNSVGAIQIAGTAEASQLPFFVAACDYTLLGEEMFAASAYLSREPEQLGMLRGQDFAKLLAGALIIGGCIDLLLPEPYRVSTLLEPVRAYFGK